jgi:phage replisome organizer, putative, N-terminal region
MVRSLHLRLVWPFVDLSKRGKRMGTVQWIKLTTTMFDDEKIKLIESMPDKDSILIIWIKLLVQAGKCNATGYIYLNETLPYTDEMLATIFNRPLNTIRLALSIFQKFGMIELSEEGNIFINNWEKHQNIEGLEKIREQTRLRVSKHRKQKGITQGVTGTVTLRNATE